MKDRILNVFIWLGSFTHGFRERLNNERGAGTVEYALIIAVIVFGIIGAATLMFDPLKEFFTGVIDKIKGLAGV